MALRTTYSAETWDRIYQAFSEVSFVSYDFDSIKQSLIDYTKTYYPEVFNDYIESSEFIALIESFAYVAEQLAYRVDMMAHENFVTTAQRKQSILRLAKLVSYKPTRNIPVRGLIKFNTVSTTERVVDSRGTDLAGLTIKWNDPNNSNWKEQFILVMNRVLNTRFGQPSKTFQIGDVVMDLYGLRNTSGSFTNGVFPFTAQAGQDSYPMEVVPADIDSNGPFEREPDLTSPLSIIYANDGIGDGSDYTGFLGFVKQGALTRIDYNIADALPDRRLDFDPTNVNHTDIWVQKLDSNSNISERWTQVDTLSENLVFNSIRNTRKKFEVDTGENDKITLIFGDGDFSDIPQGLFRFWMRQSANRSIVVQKNKVQNVPFNFSYTSTLNNTESCSMTFSLTTTLQNGSATETIEHIRQSMPGSFYVQDRMVNGQDYNTLLLEDPSILRLNTINRTFAGQPKYIDWNDASGTYENVKLFGDDATMRYQLSLSSQTTSVSGQALIDSVIEPLLSTSGVINTLLHSSATTPGMQGVVSAPRRKFIEDNRGGIYSDATGTLIGDGSLKEKTSIQGLIDRHWYGEPLQYVQAADGTVLAQIPDPDLNPKDDSKIYAATVPRTIDGVNRFPPGDIGSGLQPIADQDYFALRYNRYFAGIGTGTITPVSGFTSSIPATSTSVAEVWTIEVAADGGSLYVRSNLRGSFPTGAIGDVYSILLPGETSSKEFFTVTSSTTNPLQPGDAFILDTNSDGSVTQRLFSDGNPNNIVNLNGWWEIISAADLTSEFANGPDSSMYHDQKFTPSVRRYSWVIFIRKLRQNSTIIGYEVHNREVALTIRSEDTNFWFNTVDQLLDNETKDVVYDNIKILGSNFNSAGIQLKKNQIYDVVGPVKDSDGVLDVHQLQIVPSDLLKEDDSGDLVPDRLLQYETFSGGTSPSYEYFLISNPTVTLTGIAASTAAGMTWGAGAFVDDSLVYGRRQRMPALDSGNTGLDFMWQHFTPFTNIIDPTPTNIHDAYVLTSGYYNNVIDYVRGTSVYAPTPPTPLELRNSYGDLLRKKMLSDTVVMHSGKIRLLFGGLAEPQLRAKFKVVKSLTGTLTDERIKEEVLDVINTFFDIDNWDFGDTFYATKLIALIHQRLPEDVAAVVPVPVY